MTSLGGVGQPERATQNRVVVLFRDQLEYRYLGDWTARNSNITAVGNLAKIPASPPKPLECPDPE